jgi:hypothetical protein
VQLRAEAVAGEDVIILYRKGKKIIVGTALREVGRKNCLAQFNLATVHFGSRNIFVEHLVRT